MRDESGIQMGQPVLTFEQVTGKKRRFARNQFVLHNISFSMEAGYIYGLMGRTLKFQLAFAIAHSPSLYLLDEVTAGMDPVFRTEFFHR